VLKSSRKVIIDSKGGANGNMIYLPLDKLLERSTRGDTETTVVTARPPVSVESEGSSQDARSRGER
jgi:hypothetical protein